MSFLLPEVQSILKYLSQELNENRAVCFIKCYLVGGKLHLTGAAIVQDGKVMSLLKDTTKLVWKVEMTQTEVSGSS